MTYYHKVKIVPLIWGSKKMILSNNKLLLKKSLKLFICVSLIAIALKVIISRHLVLNRNLEQKLAQNESNLKDVIASGYPRLIEETKLFAEVDYFINGNFELQSWIFDHNNPDNVNLTLIEIINLLTQMRSNGVVYGDVHLHRYDNFDEVKRSNSKLNDDRACVFQLNNLIERTKASLKDGYQSRDLNLLLLLDTFGRITTDFLTGNTVLMGSYKNCLKRRIIDQNEGINVGPRYCIAGLTTPSAGQGLGKEIKIGVCLPETCDSIDDGRKHELIKELIELNCPSLHRFKMKFNSLYCLPDEQSEIRQWMQSKAALTFVAFITIWLAFLLYCTYKFMKQDERSRQSPSIHRALSLEYNTINLFKINYNEQQATDIDQRPDFGCLDGIKVISMIFIIMAHLLMVVCMISKSKNILDGPLLVISNMIPAFAVNTFFCITGMLTAFRLFEANFNMNFFYNPAKWTALLVMRYIRIVPVYLVVFAYMKTISKFMGAGPFWDYGTSSLSMRRSCENESWFTVLRLGANFKSPFDHCIPSAWYLANDFQFFIITPLLIIILDKRPALGKRILNWATVVSFACGFQSVYFSNATEVRPIIRFMPHAFKTYTTFMTSNYTEPQNRISAYLIGIRLGYWLYERSHRKKYAPSDKDDQIGQLITYGPHATVLSMLLLLLSPKVGSMLIVGKITSRILLSFIMPLYHLVVSLSLGLYILDVVVNKRNGIVERALKSSIWKPFARVSLCALVVNIEVINILTQSRTNLELIDAQHHLEILIMTLAAVYTVACFVFVTFEAPLKETQNLLLFKKTSKVKQ